MLYFSDRYLFSCLFVTKGLCRALVWVPDYDGFFYTNDVKVLVEVIIRELANMPHMEGASVFEFPGSSEDRTFKTRELYVRLVGDLVDRTAWRSVGEKHKYVVKCYSDLC